MLNDASPPVIVIGAGIVGVCCALYLQRDGRRVVLLDPRDPGDACSFGNAGLLATGGAAPEAMPGIAWKVPRMLRDPLGPLAIRWQYLPQAAPWLLRLVFNSRPDRVEEISRALAQLSAQVLDAYQPLLKSARAQDLVLRRGWLHLFESEDSFRGSQYGRDLRRRRGVRIDDVGPDDIRQLAPGLAPIFARGAFFPDFAHTVDPKRLTQTLADDFLQNGTFRRAEARGFDVVDGRIHGVVTNEGTLPASDVVIAAGAWSKRLVAELGTRLPLETERGYHVMLPNSGVDVPLPLMSGEGGFAITPMEHGLRIAGTVEIAGLEAPPNPERNEAMLRRARRMLPGLDTTTRKDWMGFRPSFPDALPVIDRAPKVANAFLAFGHCHRGLSFAAVTGRLIAALVAGRAPEMDIAPYNARRFEGLGSFARPYMPATRPAEVVG